ncbi:MAG: ABC transporter ATP-binding protein [Rhodothermales bacterium]
MMIEINNLLKTYGGVRALEIEGLSVGQGEIVGVAGNNGAGKTTLLRSLLDLIRVDRGRIRIDGEDVQSSTAWKRATGSYLDPSFVIGYLRPSEYFDVVSRLYEFDDLEARLAPYEAFFRGDIARERKFIRDLSAGNVDKVGITAAFLPRPQIILLDEPFAHLDPAGRAWLKAHMRNVHRDHGTTFLISSHDLADVLDVCGRLILLRDGLVVEDVRTEGLTLAELERRFLSG